MHTSARVLILSPSELDRDSVKLSARSFTSLRTPISCEDFLQPPEGQLPNESEIVWLTAELSDLVPCSRRLRNSHPDSTLVVLINQPNHRLAINLMHAGATEVLSHDEWRLLGEFISKKLQRHSTPVSHANDSRLGPTFFHREAELRSHQDDSTIEDDFPAPKFFRSEDARILEKLFDGIIATDIEGFITYWNEGVTRLFGWAALEMLGRPLDEILAHEMRTEFGSFLSRHTPAQIVEREFPQPRSDGSKLWVKSRWRVFVDDQGEEVGFLCVFNDISRRKLAERERDRLLSRLQLHIQRLPLAYILYDADLRCVDWNPAAERIFGYSKEEIVSQDVFALVHPDDRLAVQNVLARLRNGEISAHSVNRNVTKDGRIIVCEWHNTPLLDENNKHVGVLSMTMDVTERVRSEAALRESEERLRLALSAGKMGTFDWNIQTNEIVWSDSHYEIFGYPKGNRFKVQFRHFADRIHPDDRDRIQSQLEEAKQNRTSYSNESRLLLPDGTIRWVMGAGKFYYSANDSPIRMLGTVVDITDRKNAEMALKASEAQFRTFMDNMPAGAWVLDEDSRVVFVNRFYGMMAGVDPEWMVGKTAKDLYPPDIAAEHQANDRLVLERNAPFETTESYSRSDGTPGIVLSVKFPLGHDGKKKLMGGVALEITERAKLQADLMMRDRAIQAVPQGIVISDATCDDHPIVYASPGFERLTGYSEIETIGRNCRFLQGSGTDPNERERLRLALKNNIAYLGVLLNYRKDGTPFWNEVSISPVFDEHGKIVQHVGVQTDVTARRSLEDQLRQAQKMEAIGQLAGGVAHDFNNLLTVINGFCDMAFEDTDPDSPVRDLLSEIRDAGDRAAGLTHQLLAFSRQAIIAPRPLDLNEVLESISKMLRRLIPENIHLKTSYSPESCRILIDPGQLEQVIINLAVNARDAMPDGGKITIATDIVEGVENPGEPTLGRFVRLSVGDTGVGMSKEIVNRIFEPFFTTKALGQGTGLGLAMVYGIVQQGNGHLRVESELGVGSTFRIYLPYYSLDQGRQDTLHLPEPPRRGSETILLAEDEEGVRKLVKIALESLGYQVLVAVSGEEALRIAGSHQGEISMLISDVVMPGIGGLELRDRMRRMLPKIKVIFVSGHTNDALIRSGIESASHYFIQKPFTPVVLAKKVRDVLDEDSRD